jgi:hypothetical protein
VERRREMGGQVFYIKQEGATADDAFCTAKDQAFYDYGHRGYTGTIAEKPGFVMVECPEDRDEEEFAEELMRNDDPRILSKWAEACCIDMGEAGEGGKRNFLFFGWASC